MFVLLAIFFLSYHFAYIRPTVARLSRIEDKLDALAANFSSLAANFSSLATNFSALADKQK